MEYPPGVVLMTRSQEAHKPELFMLYLFRNPYPLGWLQFFENRAEDLIWLHRNSIRNYYENMRRQLSELA